MRMVSSKKRRRTVPRHYGTATTGRFVVRLAVTIMVVGTTSRQRQGRQGVVDAFAVGSPRGVMVHQHRQTILMQKQTRSQHQMWQLGMVKSQGRDNDHSTTASNEQNAPQGSVVGASLLFAGTAIGAGMLALPAETAACGFVPSVSSLAFCWCFTFVTSLVTLEASWTVSRRDESTGSGGFLSITQTTLGPIAEGVTALLFWVLLTSIVTAYTSEGGELISEFVHNSAPTSAATGGLSPTVGSALFMAFFASLDFFGTERVDLVNRVLVTGLVATFLSLLGIGLPQVDSGLLERADWAVVYPDVISVGILSLGAQNVVPTLLKYLGGDAQRTKQAVLLGSLLPLVMYTLWEAVFLGIVPYDPTGSKMEIVSALGTTSGTIVQELVKVFSACAIGSSMAGASVSLVDFFEDALANLGVKDETDPEEESSGLGKRLVAASLALGPPLGIACVYPDAFLGLLENVGLLGGVSLYGVLPALALIQLRKGSPLNGDNELMPGRLIGGTPALFALVGVSTVLVLSDVAELGRGLLR